ncbi:TVP38/TMEM64 family protein [Verrucomicrobiota bacterium sgz303538]
MSALVERLLQQILALQHTFLELGWLGVLAYAAVIAVFQMTMLPLSPLAIAGGLIFGPQRGFIALTLGTGAGAAINFMISRHIARDPFARRLGQNEKFRLIDAAIGREGWKIVALLRFCPIPFGLANFCYGLTAIPFWPYFVATVLAIIPGNLFFTWLGATAHEGLQAVVGAGRPRHPGEYALMVAGLLAGFAALTYITKIARAAVAKGHPVEVEVA